jgi:hypothetical protein
MLQRLGACLVRTALFVYFAIVVVGPSWQLWVGTAMFLVPQALSVFEDRFPSSPALSRALPGGLLELVLMLFVVTALGTLLLAALGDSKSFLPDSFLLLSVPGFLLSIAGLFGRDEQEDDLSWPSRLGGVVVLALGVMLARGMLL